MEFPLENFTFFNKNNIGITCVHCAQFLVTKRDIVPVLSHMCGCRATQRSIAKQTILRNLMNLEITYYGSLRKLYQVFVNVVSTHGEEINDDYVVEALFVPVFPGEDVSSDGSPGPDFDLLDDAFGQLGTTKEHNSDSEEGGEVYAGNTDTSVTLSLPDTATFCRIFNVMDLFPLDEKENGCCNCGDYCDCKLIYTYIDPSLGSVLFQ